MYGFRQLENPNSRHGYQRSFKKYIWGMMRKEDLKISVMVANLPVWAVISVAEDDQTSYQKVSILSEILASAAQLDRSTNNQAVMIKASALERVSQVRIVTEMADGIIIEDVQDELLKDCYQNLNPQHLQGCLIDTQNVDIGGTTLTAVID
ncbi:hypothetical protein GYMLUDRAFT_65080 [Collybiopsis luxurians FD-317 M1]|uniref:Uncharacterized protein n=1 Tax=Collybiopsis luxurians FD-317 M1 TaxID=944289 RepID=A0A0D0AL68_9AGAR|nr:hypothetical protein GYMLUDRAFT_65080 [Collybiopsis luxurians FD-317 M1]